MAWGLIAADLANRHRHRIRIVTMIEIENDRDQRRNRHQARRRPVERAVHSQSGMLSH